MVAGYYQLANRTYGQIWCVNSLTEARDIIEGRQSGAFGLEVITDCDNGLEIVAIDEWEMPDTYTFDTVYPT